ncbi:hypothetical protein J3E68DRAFT_407393 [Trichoderma sp. SZMC 28012]
MERVPCPYSYTIYNTQYIMHHSSISQPLLPPQLFSMQAHAVNASSLCLRTSRGAATGGLHKVPRTRKHCQRSRGGAVPDTPSRMFRTCGPAMAAQPRLYRSSQPAIDFSQCQRSFLALLLVGGERREKLRWDQMHAPCNQRRSLETGVSKQRGKREKTSIVERAAKKKKFTEGARSRRRTRPRTSC